MKVLICDDNPKIINQINNYLLKISKQSTYKFDSICFSNGDSILDKQTKIDFAFIDIEMPGVNGLTVTKHLQKINPNINYLHSYFFSRLPRRCNGPKCL